MRHFHLVLATCTLVFGFQLTQAVGPTPGPVAGPGKLKAVTIAFYNMENLFDTEDDPTINDEEFLPKGTYEWTPERYKRKIANMSKVIDQLGDEDGPEVLGMCEVENLKVVQDLVGSELLKKKGYGIVHANSPDQRGIDCALIYKSKRFTPLYQSVYHVTLPDNKDFATRDILLVKGIMDKSVDVTFIVNHWPSRRDGAEESAIKRQAAAATLRFVIDSIQDLDPQANIVMMGDFNDEPGDVSIHDMLHAGRDSVEAVSTMLYNCMAPIKAEGRGSLKFKGGWNLFDQMMVSSAMINNKSLVHYVKGSANIYNPQWMRQTDAGDWMDAPKRTFIGKKYVGEDGYSDHFPVYISLEF